MKLIILMCLLIAPSLSFAAVEHRWKCVGGAIARTSFDKDHVEFFGDIKAKDYEFTVKAEYDRYYDRPEITQDKPMEKGDFTDCFEEWDGAFSCTASDSRNEIFYFEPVARHFQYSVNQWATAKPSESFLVLGKCTILNQVLVAITPKINPQ